MQHHMLLGHTVYTMYHHNTHIRSTKIQALGTLKIPFDIVFESFQPWVSPNSTFAKM